MTGIDITQLATEINDAYTEARTKYKLLCTLCGKAIVLTRDKKDEFFKLLSFASSKFSKFAAIGSNEYLWTPYVERHLTGSYTIDYEVASLTNKEIDAAIAKGVLHSNCTRAQILQYKASVRPKNRRPATRRVVATISLLTSASDKDKQALNNALEALWKISGVKIVRPETAVEKAKKQYVTDLQNRVRDAAAMAVRLAPVKARPEKSVEDVFAVLQRGSNTEIAQVLSSYGSNFETVKGYAYEAVPVPPIVLKRHTEEERKTWIALEDAGTLAPFLIDKTAGGGKPKAKPGAQERSGS